MCHSVCESPGMCHLWSKDRDPLPMRTLWTASSGQCKLTLTSHNLLPKPNSSCFCDWIVCHNPLLSCKSSLGVHKRAWSPLFNSDPQSLTQWFPQPFRDLFNHHMEITHGMYLRDALGAPLGRTGLTRMSVPGRNADHQCVSSVRPLLLQ